MKRNALRASRLALAAAAGTLCLFVNDNMSSTRSNLLTQASAEVGRPLTAGSVAGVARRHERRAYRRDAYIGGTAGAGAYYGGGYSGDYYGGYANRSYVTGRPTLFPRYYGGAYAAYGSAGGYSGDYYSGYGGSGYDAYASAADDMSGSDTYILHGNYISEADAVAYCAQRFRSYDIESRTFLASSGQRKSCPQ